MAENVGYGTQMPWVTNAFEVEDTEGAVALTYEDYLKISKQDWLATV